MQVSTLNPSRNLAARVGRWSASHRKIAIFGWLAFVIVSVAIGTGAGQKTIDQQNQNVGQAHRADQMLKQAGFSQSGPLNEIVVIQSKTLTVDSPAFQAVVGDVVRTVAPFSTVRNLSSPSAHTNRDQVSHDRHTALVEWDMSGPLKAAETRIDPLTHAVASVAKAHPGFYVGEAGCGQLRQGADQSVQPAARPGRNTLDPADPADPGACVRVAARRLDTADARADVRDRDGRDYRHHQPHHADGPERPSGRVARRSRGGRRLHAVLPPSRARRARRRPRRAGRARGGRRDFGSLGADLGRHRDDRDGRDAVLRRSDVRLILDRDDDRRRGRDARLAHRAPGAALKARRPRREGTDPAARPPAASARRGTDLVEGPDPRPASSGHLGEPRRGSRSSRWRSPRSTCTPRSQVRSRCRAAPRRSRRWTASRQRSPASQAPP